MKSKEERIADIELEIAKKFAELELEIARLKDETYVLTQIEPDCGGGISDRQNNIAISKNIDELIKYSEDVFSYSPSLTNKRPESDKEFCKTWYRITPTNLLIL